MRRGRDLLLCNILKHHVCKEERGVKATALPTGVFKGAPQPRNIATPAAPTTHAHGRMQAGGVASQPPWAHSDNALRGSSATHTGRNDVTQQHVVVWDGY